MSATRVKAQRKISKFEMCDRHAPWFAGESRYRIAETFGEGGPWMGEENKGCAGGRCRLWPGRDFYSPAYCDGELDLDWTTA